MNHKQRVFAAIRGEPLDRLPFGARIDLWYNYHRQNGSLPEQYQGCSMHQVNRDLGAGTQFRMHKVWREAYRGVEATSRVEDSTLVSEFKTPHGKLRCKMHLDEKSGAISGYYTEPLFKDSDDYRALVYLIEHEDLEKDDTEYRRLLAEAGDEATIAVGNATGPLQIIMKEIMGYESFFYEYFDHRRSLDALHEALRIQWHRKLEILVEVGVEFPVVCGNWSGETHTPLFEAYILPWLQESSEYLHNRGHIAMVHVDGELRGLSTYLPDTNVDVAECWSPAPMTSLTTAELREDVGDSVALWGGVASQLFEPMYTDEQFDTYVRNLLSEVAPGYRYIVGMGENVSPTAIIERVRRVRELIDEAGPVPIDAGAQNAAS